MSISAAGADVLRAGGTRVTVSRSLSFSGVANAVARACFILAVPAYRIPRRAPQKYGCSPRRSRAASRTAAPLTGRRRVRCGRGAGETGCSCCRPPATVIQRRRVLRRRNADARLCRWPPRSACGTAVSHPLRITRSTSSDLGLEPLQPPVERLSGAIVLNARRARNRCRTQNCVLAQRVGLTKFRV